eukprot:TRINITY_DN148196_c0_g1_i1.p2 TRINITY_DN148196_c0_g1~~TRINITY_DN148196_c0_g1_i1.p2  ORF type:complete len:106 (+),score=7.89 TRINITY_DN148196_c0_g1_i1:28-345(+)
MKLQVCGMQECATVNGCTCYTCVPGVLPVCEIRVTPVSLACYRCARYGLHLCPWRVTGVRDMGYTCVPGVLQVCGMQDMCDSVAELEAKLCRDLDKAVTNKGQCW